MSNTGIIDIRGKEYQTVALRVKLFRDDFPLFTLATEVVERDEDCVVMRAEITNEEGRIIATGHAEEYRKSSQINKTSALENAETSAIGRALAAFGYGGTEFATANEVQNAIHQQVAPANDAKPKGWREQGSIYSTPTALHRGMAALERELMACGDSDMVYALTGTEDWREFVRVAEIHSPHYLRGGDPAPPEFEGLQNIAERLVREFDSTTANHMADLARN